MSEKKKLTMDDGREVVRYENNGATPEERRAICKENSAKFERDAKAGKVCSLSDLEFVPFVGAVKMCEVCFEKTRGF